MATIKFRRGAFASIPTLAAGEPGWASDTQDLYMGTGSGNIKFAKAAHTFSSAYLSGRPIADADLADVAGVTAYYLISGASHKPPGTDHALLTLSYLNDWSIQLAGDWRTNNWYIRKQENSVWGSWSRLLTQLGGTFSGAVYARDHGTGSIDEVVNVCYGAGSPPTANTTTIGTIWFKYI